MDAETLAVWNVVGTWVASIGTVAAVITSLWLALHRDRVELRITVGHRILIDSYFDTSDEYCYISIVNRGDRMVRITSIGWEAGILGGKRHFVQVFGNANSDKIPKNLEHGEEGRFLVPFYFNGDDQDWGKSFPMAANEDGWNRLRNLKLVVSTSVGQVFKVRAEKGLKEKLIANYKDNS